MTIDLVPVDGEILEEPPVQETLEPPSPREEAVPEPEEPAPPAPKRRGRPPGAKNKPKSPPPPTPEPEEDDEGEEEPPPLPKKRVRIAPAERLPEPKVSQAVPVEVLIRQRMMDVQARATEDRALRQAHYTEVLAKKMGFY